MLSLPLWGCLCGCWILVTQHSSCSSSCSQLGDPPSPEAAVQELSRAWLGALSVRACTQRQEPTACGATQASVSAYDFWPLLRAQNWSNQGSSQAEPQLCPAELLVVTKLAQIPPAQNLGCYSSSNAVNCVLPKESPDRCSSCTLETDVQLWVSMGYTNLSPGLVINRNT